MVEDPERRDHGIVELKGEQIEQVGEGRRLVEEVARKTVIDRHEQRYRNKVHRNARARK